MSAEVERKFVPAEPPAELGPGRDLRQGYLAQEEDVEVRLRVAEDGAVLTVKAGQGLVRTEVELPLSDEQARALWPHTAGRRLEKVRHAVELDVHDAVVDVYGGALAGLCVVEVEFDTEEQAAAFEPPAWFGREVTGQRGWSNAALARHGAPR